MREFELLGYFSLQAYEKMTICVPKLGAFLLDLNGQLTRRSEDERNGPVARRQERLPANQHSISSEALTKPLAVCGARK